MTSSYCEFARRNRDAKSIIFYCDNCSSQNKCWVLFSSMPRIVNDPTTATKDITFKYFEPGHSFMMADSVHGNIQSKLSSCSTIGDLTDYVKVIGDARNDLTCVMFIDHTSMQKFCQENKKVPFLLKDVKVAEFRRGSLNVFVKMSHMEDEFKEYEFLRKLHARDIESKIRRGDNSVDCIPVMESPRGIPAKKKEQVLQLVANLPAHKKRFYEQLLVNILEVTL